MDEIGEEVKAIWIGDVLQRRDDSQYLQKYLCNRYLNKPTEPGFVLAINAEWGYGKSFMLERWQKEVALQGYPTVFFDAWKNDFTSDPLLAFIAELDFGLEEFFKRIPLISRIAPGAIRKIKTLWKPALNILAFAAAKHLTGMAVPKLAEMFEGPSDENNKVDRVKRLDSATVSKELKDSFNKALEEHKTTKKAILNFKQKLSTLIIELKKTAGIELPLFIFVDELDRCRPTYAIELLEGIKHLFGVPGVYFVVATNIQQLSHSIKAVYGSEFDGQTYLKRFFDMQYTLPEPSNEPFARMLFSEMSKPESHFLNHGLNNHALFPNHAMGNKTSEDILTYVFILHVNAFNLGLRDQYQIASLLEAAFLSLNGERVDIFFLIFLAVVYHKDSAAFKSIEKNRGVTNEPLFASFSGSKEAESVCTVVRNNRDQNSSMKPVRHNMLDIARIYFSALTMSDEEHSRIENDRIDFPKTLLRGVLGTQEGRTFIPAFGKYFEIIQHAGGFASKS